MKGDYDARRTLAVAGGVALIADKLLTRNVGSSLGVRREKGGVPFRSDVNKVIEGLSRQTNELGLWTLALAANTFRDDDLPQNSVPKQSLTGKETATSDEPPYVYFKVDLAAEDHIARDAAGVPVPLYEWDVVAASDPDRATQLVVPPPAVIPAPVHVTTPTAVGGEPGQAHGEPAEGEPAEGAESTSAAPGAPAPGLDPVTALFQYGAVPGPRDQAASVPPSQRAAAHRKALHLGVQGARDALDHLHTLEPEVGGHTPIVPVEQLDELHDLLVGILTDVENLRRRTVGDHAPEDGAPEPDGALELAQD